MDFDYALITRSKIETNYQINCLTRDLENCDAILFVDSLSLSLQENRQKREGLRVYLPAIFRKPMANILSLIMEKSDFVREQKIALYHFLPGIVYCYC